MLLNDMINASDLSNVFLDLAGCLACYLVIRCL